MQWGLTVHHLFLNSTTTSEDIAPWVAFDIRSRCEIHCDLYPYIYIGIIYIYISYRIGYIDIS